MPNWTVTAGDVEITLDVSHTYPEFEQRFCVEGMQRVILGTARCSVMQPGVSIAAVVGPMPAYVTYGVSSAADVGTGVRWASTW